MFSEAKGIYGIIKSPIVSEKSTKLGAWRKYAFYVDLKTNKIEIKKALEKLYKVKVAKINSLILKGKTKRLRFNQPGKTVSRKKVIVTLKPGFEIKLS